MPVLGGSAGTHVGIDFVWLVTCVPSVRIRFQAVIEACARGNTPIKGRIWQETHHHTQGFIGPPPSSKYMPIFYEAKRSTRRSLAHGGKQTYISLCYFSEVLARP